MNKILILIVLALALLIGLLAFLVLMPEKNNVIVEDAEGITVLSPKPGETITSPLKITGFVNGGGWIGFEAQVGTVKLFDKDNNELALGILTAKGEWMQVKIDFETELNFVSEVEGEGRLVFYNENPSGEPGREKTFTIPVKLPKMDVMQVSVFFNNAGNECQNVVAVKRNIQKTEAPARAALEELLRGPSAKESALFTTGINQGVKIQKLTIESGIAKVDFNGLLEAGVAGSCRVLGIRAQIEKTLLQFPTVKSVIISIDGKTEGILQP